MNLACSRRKELCRELLNLLTFPDFLFERKEEETENKYIFIHLCAKHSHTVAIGFCDTLFYYIPLMRLLMLSLMLFLSYSKQ